MPSFYEFFAGGGMARKGLGPDWHCLFANDFDHKKAKVYRDNWGDGEMVEGDVRNLNAADLPGLADLIWASFPCQDLSLAGGGAGLKGDRSGTFWPFWGHVTDLIKEGRKPRGIVLENVCGTLTSHKGKDFAAIADKFAEAGYRVGALVIDAALFVPHSRKRLFIVGIDEDQSIGLSLIGGAPDPLWSSLSLERAYANLSREAQAKWIWWRMKPPLPSNTRLSDLLLEEPSDVDWHTPAETRQLLDMMSAVNREKVRAAARTGKTLVGTLYKRTRRDDEGYKVQRAEVRFDNVAGCLRTPAGGSSRQLVMIVEGRKIRSRLLSAREAAYLMGLDDDYFLPPNYNEAYHLAGDGVVVNVVRHLAENILEPALAHEAGAARQAA